jgi:hypothetical protein
MTADVGEFQSPQMIRVVLNKLEEIQGGDPATLNPNLTAQTSASLRIFMPMDFSSDTLYADIRQK